MSGEFDLIDRYFRPLAGPGGLRLSDDCGRLAGDLLISKDLLVGDVHFFNHDPSHDIAAKALYSNLSDVIASGATPHSYFLGLVLPDWAGDAWLADFARGLGDIQALGGISLSGGDITHGPTLVISVTMAGCSNGRWVTRSGARPGDLLCVTGDIGRAAVGLALTTGDLTLSLSTDQRADFERARNHPAVPLGFASVLARFATSALDISDGLLGDAEHLARCSGVDIEIDLARVPLPDGLSDAFWDDPSLQATMLTGGDDFQTLFTCNEKRYQALKSDYDGQITVIGRVRKPVDASAPNVRLLDRDSKPVSLDRASGYSHNLGSKETTE